MRVAFDVGGVLSKYPELFRSLIAKLDLTDVFVISDIKPVQKIVELLSLNGLDVPTENIYSADYDTHGEACKAILLAQLGIDLFFDDFIGYVTPMLDSGYPTVRCLVMPDHTQPYYADGWRLPEDDGLLALKFGRQRYKKQDG